MRGYLRKRFDPHTPLLERVKFLAIVSTNMDEFFMIRVAGLHQQRRAGVQTTSPDGLTPSEQLTAIRAAVTAQLNQQRQCWQEDVTPNYANKASGCPIMPNWETLNANKWMTILSIKSNQY
jgi:polyphosphate kinase